MFWACKWSECDLFDRSGGVFRQVSSQKLTEKVMKKVLKECIMFRVSLEEMDSYTDMAQSRPIRYLTRIILITSTTTLKIPSK